MSEAQTETVQASNGQVHGGQPEPDPGVTAEERADRYLGWLMLGIAAVMAIAAIDRLTGGSLTAGLGGGGSADG